jgi:hypothetical protein
MLPLPAGRRDLALVQMAFQVAIRHVEVADAELQRADDDEGAAQRAADQVQLAVDELKRTLDAISGLR